MTICQKYAALYILTYKHPENSERERRPAVAKKDIDLKKYKRSELLELLIEQGRRIEQLERELDCACRALAERDADDPVCRSMASDRAFSADMRDTARKNARTLLFDVMALMQTLETTEEDVEKAEETDSQR